MSYLDDAQMVSDAEVRMIVEVMGCEFYVAGVLDGICGNIDWVGQVEIRQATTTYDMDLMDDYEPLPQAVINAPIGASDLKTMIRDAILDNADWWNRNAIDLGKYYADLATDARIDYAEGK